LGKSRRLVVLLRGGRRGETERVTGEPTKLRYVIQIERPDEVVTVSSAHELLGPLGVTIDPAYFPVVVNPKLGRYALRGVATAESRAAAERLPGIRFFADSKISTSEG
jgi:hypothetical protein